MDTATAHDYLRHGVAQLDQAESGWLVRDRYYRGDQDLPYAPQGVSVEYRELREMAPANWLGIAMDAPVQRMLVESVAGDDGRPDEDLWRSVFVPNRLAARQKLVWTQMMVHGRGMWSVSKNRSNSAQPLVRVENVRRVHLERDPSDPWRSMFAVKRWIERPKISTSLVVPASAMSLTGAREIACVYDADGWTKFERFAGGRWTYVEDGRHGLGEVPFIESAANMDADAVPHPAIVPLMPMQDALNTVRFNALLAMQFSAYRQRSISGYDPVVRDAEGNPVYRKAADGELLLDVDGQPQPVLRSPGRIGVDRALVFPGKDTRITDLPESNLDNYVKVYSQFLSDLFAVGQIPPQYLLTRMANLSGDALAGAESTLKSLVAGLQREGEEGLNGALRLANRARGVRDDVELRCGWAEGEARSFAQSVDAIVKLISVEFPREAAFEMLPGANPTKVRTWMDMWRDEKSEGIGAQLLSQMAAPAGASGGPGF